MSKGFRKAKTATKQQIIENQGTQLENLNTQLNTLLQMQYQAGQSISQVRNEINVLSMLHRMLPVARAATAEDLVMVDFAGKEGDNYNKDLVTTNSIFDLAGDNAVIPNLADQLVGKERGAFLEFECTYPEDHMIKEFSGKTIKFIARLVNVFERMEDDNMILDIVTREEKEAAEKAKSEAEANAANAEEAPVDKKAE